MRNDLLLLSDILESIDLILKHIEGISEDEFYENELINTFVIHKMMIIGEAANKLSDTIYTSYSEVEWRKMIEFRNFVVHEYFGIELEIVWTTIIENILPLRKKIEDIFIIERET